MSDIVLHAAAKASVTSQSLVTRTRAAIERLRNEEEGQDMIEYAGVLVVVAVIIAGVAVFAGGPLMKTISSGVTGLVNDIFGGKAPSTGS